MERAWRIFRGGDRNGSGEALIRRLGRRGGERERVGERLIEGERRR